MGPIGNLFQTGELKVESGEVTGKNSVTDLPSMKTLKTDWKEMKANFGVGDIPGLLLRGVVGVVAAAVFTCVIAAPELLLTAMARPFTGEHLFMKQLNSYLDTMVGMCCFVLSGKVPSG